MILLTINDMNSGEEVHKSHLPIPDAKSYARDKMGVSIEEWTKFEASEEGDASLVRRMKIVPTWLVEVTLYR